MLTNAFPLSGVVLVAALFATPQDCRKCEGTGLLDCKGRAHKSVPVALELAKGLQCSDAARCRSCSGALQELCPKCGGTDKAAARLESRRQSAARLIADLAQLEAEKTGMGMQLHMVRNNDFVLYADWRRYRLSKTRSLDSHAVAHLYIDRLAKLKPDFMAWIGADTYDFSNPTTVCLWEKQADHVRASRLFAKMPSDFGVKLMGTEPVFTTWWDRRKLHEEHEFHRSVFHNVAHCLLSNVWDGIWPGRHAGWLDAGVAHQFEMHYWNACGNYCYQEVNTFNLDFPKSRWRSRVRAMAVKGELPSLPDMTRRMTTELDLAMHPPAWSLCDWLATTRTEQWPEVIKRIKRKERFAAVMRDLFELSPKQTADTWRDWILDTYPAKEKAGIE